MSLETILDKILTEKPSRSMTGAVIGRALREAIEAERARLIAVARSTRPCPVGESEMLHCYCLVNAIKAMEMANATQ